MQAAPFVAARTVLLLENRGTAINDPVTVQFRREAAEYARLASELVAGVTELVAAFGDANLPNRLISARDARFSALCARRTRAALSHWSSHAGHLTPRCHPTTAFRFACLRSGICCKDARRCCWQRRCRAPTMWCAWCFCCARLARQRKRLRSSCFRDWRSRAWVCCMLVLCRSDVALLSPFVCGSGASAWPWLLALRSNSFCCQPQICELCTGRDGTWHRHFSLTLGDAAAWRVCHCAPWAARQAARLRLLLACGWPTPTRASQRHSRTQCRCHSHAHTHTRRQVSGRVCGPVGALRGGAAGGGSGCSRGGAIAAGSQLSRRGSGAQRRRAGDARSAA